MTIIDTTLWERSSDENWTSPSPTSLKMLKNLNHDYIVSDTQFSNYTLTSDVTTLGSDDDGLGVVFDYIDNLNYKYIMYTGGGMSGWTDVYVGNPSVVLVEVVNGTHKKLLENKTFSYWQINSTFSIKLENVFDDVVFYVNDIEALRYKKDNSVSGKIGFVTYSQICNFDNIQMYQSNANRMKAKFILYAVGNSDTLTEIEVKQYNKSDALVEIEPRAISEGLVNTEIFAIYRGNSEVLTEIQPIGYNNMPTEIEVRPHNRMMAIWEVQQPPIITETFNPTQDAFTREQSAFATINYGGNSSMVAGNSKDDIWRSFVQFDLSSINPSYVLVETKLRLYYKGVAPTYLNLELFNADSAWQEYNITNLNRPNPIRVITDEFTVKDGYVEFDVMDVVKDWVALKTINNGFIVRVSNETEVGQVTFHTRESMFPPELVVSYYDSRIFSQGRTQIVAEMFVLNRGNSDKNAEITVDSVYRFELLDTELYVHRREVPLDSEILAEIIATKPYIPTEFTVTIHKDEEVPTEISSRIEGVDNNRIKDVELAVSRPAIETEIYVKYRSDIPVEISPRVIGCKKILAELSVTRDVILVEITPNLYGDSSILTEVIINKPYIETQISVSRQVVETTISTSRDSVLVEATPRLKREAIIDTEIFIVNEPHSKVTAEISVSRPNTDSEMVVRAITETEIDTQVAVSRKQTLAEITINGNIVLSEIEVRIGRQKDLYSQISITRPQVHAEVEVKWRSDIWVEIEPNIKSDVKTEIVATTPRIFAEISINGYNDSSNDVEIFVKYKNEVETEINIHVIDDVETEIDIISINKLPVEVTATKPSVHAQIVIPTWVDLDLPTVIEPRILMVDNIYTIIQVGSAGGAYAFII